MNKRSRSGTPQVGCPGLDDALKEIFVETKAAPIKPGKPIQWLLKKDAERKFREGHPWVFSSELAQSPRSIAAGALIELRSYQGHFLGRGYGHPNSLISFRTLSRAEQTVIDRDYFRRRLLQASRLRKLGGVFQWSHRLVFAEGDYLPGLVIDRFRLAGSRGSQSGSQSGSQVFVLQASTAGMDRLLPLVIEALEDLVNVENSELADWASTSIIVANDSKSRVMEGLECEPKKLVRHGSGFDPDDARLIAEPSLPDLPAVNFRADFIGGQKTGFFLDQRFNIELTSKCVAKLIEENPGRPLKILDLCCYVGQWGTHLANLARARNVEAEVTLVDASAKALELAAQNVEAVGGRAIIEKGDVLQVLQASSASPSVERFENRSFDVVICDPPAFIKKKKDLPAGSQAYYKINREAARKVRPNGLFVSSSCSGLFTDEDFRSMLARVAASSGEICWLARGGHSVDHPQRPEFPQGSYLKAWIGEIRGGVL